MPSHPREQDRIKRLIEHAWLLSETDIAHVTPTTPVDQLESLISLPVDAAHPLRGIGHREIQPEDLIRIMRDPNYFPFTCKLLMGIDIMPFQHVILRELWTRPFPMLIGSRGLGKCTLGETLIMTNNGISKIQDFALDAEPHTQVVHKGLRVLGENHFQDVAYAWKNGDSDTVVVTTDVGYQIENTHNHPMRVIVGDEIKWVDTGDLKLGDRIVIDRTESWFENTNDLTEDHGYLFGLLVGDGGYTVRGRISFTTNDQQLADSATEIFWKLWRRPLRKNKSKYAYEAYGTDLWDELFQKYGFNSPVCAEKDFPTSILGARKEVCAAFISGLFDTDGSITNQGILEFTSKSEALVRTLQFVLTRFGIISHVSPKYNKKYDRTYYRLYMMGKHRNLFAEKINFRLQRKCDQLASFLSTPTNTNKDTIPSSLIQKHITDLQNDIDNHYGKPKRGSGRILARKAICHYKLKTYGMTYERLGSILDKTSELSHCQSWQSLKAIHDRNLFFDRVTSLKESKAVTYDLYVPSDHSFVSNGFISHNSFILALYSMLRLVFTQGSKVAVIGASFRQSKVIFEYMEKVWADGAILRDLCGTGKGRAGREQGPRRDVDRCEMIIGDSVGIAIPLGNGEKIRGQRANYILADEFACLGRGTLVETDRGLFRIEETEDMRDFCLNTGDERGYEEPAHFIKTPPTKAYKVTVRSGYSFVCSGIHQVLTREGWKLGRELEVGDMLPMPNSYEFPKSPVVADDLVLDGNVGWCLGLLISEGAVSSPHTIAVQMTDQDCVDRFAERIGNFVPPGRVKRYSRGAYVDKRGWKCKSRYSAHLCHKEFRQKLEKLGLEYHTAHNKKTPSGILQSPKQVVIAYLAGLFEGDGSAFLFESKGRSNHLGVSYYSVSEQLVRETQILLLKLGLKSSIQARASKLSDNPQWMLRLNGAHAHNLVNMLQIPKWQKVVDAAVEPVDRSEAGVVWDKSRNKWAARVSDFGKSKHLGRFDSREEALSCVLQEKKTSCQPVISVEELPGEQVLFDYYLPEGHRFVANGFVQHNSIPEDIYQNVVRGFASVSADPASGVRHQARVQLLKKLGQWTQDDDIAEAKIMRSNQNIISGTAYYSFNHFYKTWKTYKAFIESRGDRKKLEEIFDGPVPEGFDWRDFSIIRIPVDMLPRGFMDEKQISSARATLSKSNYMIEFGASFATDSEGFFKRSLIESCVVGRPDNPIVLNEETVEFSASLVGDDVPHVIAVDPASERDHFSVVVLALYSDHRRLVHCWTTNRKSHKERLKRGVVKEQNFYAFCARKLRELMLAFPNVEVLGIDSQGGGVTVEESLHDLEKLKDGEMPLWREIDPDPKKYKDSDGKPGLHIIRMINFADARWIVDANHGLRKDLEDKVLLLPAFDTAALGLAYEEDKAAGRIVLEDGEEISLYDTLEDAVVDIEELKDELASIVHTATAGGRDRWDVPGAKLPGSKAGKQRKDRYSALLMANAIARDIQRTEAPQEYHPVGGFAADIKDADGDLYIGPSWFVEATRGDYGAAVGRDGVELADPTA